MKILPKHLQQALEILLQYKQLIMNSNSQNPGNQAQIQMYLNRLNQMLDERDKLEKERNKLEKEIFGELTTTLDTMLKDDKNNQS